MTTSKPDGYLAKPNVRPVYPVLVLHAWWGLNNTIRDFCRRLSTAGFTAFAPDLYHGTVVDTISEAEKMSSALDDNCARTDVKQATSYLLSIYNQPPASLSVIGFSLGAYFALDLSISEPDLVHSVVVYYGTGPGDFSHSRAAYLGHFAEKDPYEPPENVDALEKALMTANRPVALHRYPATGHWFCEPDRADAYNQNAAELAWERTLAFLEGQTHPTLKGRC